MSYDYNEFKDDFYALLEVGRDADEATIKAAYREKTKYYFPDFGNVPNHVAEAMTKLLNEASEVLLDATKKRRYDAFWDATFKNRRQSRALSAGQGGTIARPEDVEIKDYYNALHLTRNSADENSIRGAYLAVLNQFKPQLQGENSQVAQNIIACAEEAYGVLSRPETKALYDAQYDKAYPAKASETPRVRGEITVVRPRNIEPVYTRGEVTVVRPERKSQLSTVQKRESRVTPYRTTAPIVKSQNANASVAVQYGDKTKLVSMINSRLLGMKLSRPNSQGKKIYLHNLYALLSEDHSFQFVKEYRQFNTYGYDYFLISVPGEVDLTGGYESESVPWRRQEVITLNGLKSIVIPAIKLLPTQLISIGGFFDLGDYIRYEDLRTIHDEIFAALNQNPGMIDAYFGKNRGKKM